MAKRLVPLAKRLVPLAKRLKFNKEELHKEYAIAYENYVISNTHTSFISLLHLQYFFQYPNNLTNDWKKAFRLAEKYANSVSKNMEKNSKDDLMEHESVEKYSISKINEYIDDEYKNIPIMIQELGEIIYHAKSAPKNIEGLDQIIKYLDFEWYNHASRLVLTHSFFEAFVTKTIDIVCKVKPDLITKYLKPTKPLDLSDNNKWDKTMKRLHKKIGLGRFEKRLDFLRDCCNLKNLISKEREESLKFLEQVRHLIVHKNGIIDKKFLYNLRGTKFTKEYLKEEIGEKINLILETVLEQRSIIYFLAAELFTKTCVKYLDK